MASFVPMTSPKHYEEQVLNCLTQYQVGATVLAAQVMAGWGGERGDVLPTKLECWYGGGTCKWCKVHHGVLTKEHILHMLALCPAHKEIRVQAIREVSTLYQDLVGHKAQWAKWMGVEPIHMWTGCIPKLWYQKAHQAAAAKGQLEMADQWATGHVLTMAHAVTSMHYNRLNWMKEQGLFCAAIEQPSVLGEGMPVEGVG